ncbi:uncharacterized protein BDV17DRAFT_293419 [Aspergillus undulatus]|uniref:uncharacterized protein n=1 Tax=Aspergillus undulatus TaxID=1810928 RepID=UPI003CCD0904
MSDWSNAMWCLLWSFNDLAMVGLRALLTAIFMDRREVVELIMNIGMRKRLTTDESIKLFGYGWTCKHGTVEMLDVLDIHGPYFNWRAYYNWCWLLTTQTGNVMSGSRVLSSAIFTDSAIENSIATTSPPSLANSEPNFPLSPTSFGKSTCTGLNAG